MIYSAEAERQIANLRRHYDERDRTEALHNLVAALIEAEAAIESGTPIGRPAPRPYPHLARPGRLWLKAGRYWIAYSSDRPSMILAVFYDQANIPGRL